MSPNSGLQPAFCNVAVFFGESLWACSEAKAAREAVNVAEMAKKSFKKDRLLCFTRSPGQLRCRWLRGLPSVATDESCHVLWLVGRPFISIFPRGLAPVIRGLGISIRGGTR